MTQIYQINEIYKYNYTKRMNLHKTTLFWIVAELSEVATFAYISH